MLGFATLSFPLSPAGFSPATACGGFGAIENRVAGVPFPDGTASAFYRTAVAGNPPPNATATRRGFDARTPFGRGHMSLVTPIAIQSTVSEDFPSFARLNLTFVLEPSPLLGFLAGAITVGLLGLRRCRRLVAGAGSSP